MNEAAANALYEAERKGVRQTRGASMDESGGMCAGQVLLDAGHYSNQAMWECPLCGRDYLCLGWSSGEANIIVHLNDDHDLTFSEIARKLGPDAA